MATDKTRAALYGRVSTIDQGDGASLTTQKNECLRYCQANGLTVLAEYQDLQSGMKADREQYAQMLREAEAGAFDVIVCWKMDRFGRDRLESGFQVRELQKIGVRVDSATEPNDSPLLRNILMDFAEEESRRISMRVSANKKTLAQQGKRTSKAPFGYSNVPHPEGGRSLEPNQDAPVVAQAFEMYASGRHSLSDVRDYVAHASLTPNRPTTRAGAHHLLRNPVYMGSVRHGFYANSKIQVKPKADRLADVFISKGQHPPIVDEDTWYAVQQRLQGNQPKNTGRPKTSFMFTGLTWCACGYRFSGKTTGGTKIGGRKIMYYCVRQNDVGDCDSRSVSENKIKEQVIPPIQNLLAQLSQEGVRAEVRRQLAEDAEDRKAADRADKENLSVKLGRMEKRMRTWLEMVGDGEMSREEYARVRTEYEPQIAELRQQLEDKPYLALPDVDRLLSVAETVTIDAGEVTVNGEPLDDQAWRELVEGMVDRITIEGTGDGRKNPPKISVIWKPEYDPLLEMVSEVKE